MIHKAAVVISELRESEKGFIFSSRIAEAALEAAGVAKMVARIAELEAGIAELGGIIKAHDVRLESCDRDGNEFCDCLERAIKKLNAPSGAGGE